MDKTIGTAKVTQYEHRRGIMWEIRRAYVNERGRLLLSDDGVSCASPEELLRRLERRDYPEGPDGVAVVGPHGRVYYWAREFECLYRLLKLLVECPPEEWVIVELPKEWPALLREDELEAARRYVLGDDDVADSFATVEIPEGTWEDVLALGYRFAELGAD